MTLDDSVDLILTTLENAKTGETWIPKLNAMKIIDLANIYAEMYGKTINFTGIRPVEKMHESLISDSESTRTIELENHYVIRPAYDQPTSENVFEYSSGDSCVEKEDLKAYLDDLKILDKNIDEFVGRTIQEHKRD